MAQGKKRPSSASEAPPAKRRAGSKSTVGPTAASTQHDLLESSHQAATFVKPGVAAANRLKWTPKLRKAIEDAGRETPRFLSSVLCHPPTQDLSSCSRVCGYEYESKHLPDSIFDLSPGDLLTSTLSDHPGSAFNHWLVVFPHIKTAVLKASEYIRENAPNRIASVAVLDTERALQPVTVLATKDLRLLDIPFGEAYTHETFHLFGGMDINEANASIVPYSKLRNEFVPDIPWVRTLKLSHVLTRKLPTGGQNLVLDIGKAIGQLFGPDFALIVACMAIATLPNESSDVYKSWTYDDHGPKLQAASALLDLHLPDGWSGHTKVVYDMGSVKDPAVHRAMSLLRLVIATKNRVPGPGFSFAQLEGDPDTLSLKSMAKEVDSINFGMAKSDLEETADASSEFQPGASVAMYSEVSNPESEKTVVQLPAGPMDAESKTILLAAQERTPRYLFRGWRHGIVPSGGLEKLNSPEAIMPWAYLVDTNTQLKSSDVYMEGTTELPFENIFHLTRAELCSMVTTHLAYQKPAGFKTEFSSWAASLRVAFGFASKYGCKDGYISVIDTKELEGRNVIVHAPSMRPFVGSISSFPDEYLAHGVISGPAHKAIPLQAFLDANALTDYLSYSPLRINAQLASPITVDELHAAHNVAAQYGTKFGAAVMIAILTLKTRDAKFWRDGMGGTHELVNSKTLDFVIPKRLCADATVLADIVHVDGFGEVEQMLRMLRAIVDLRHGKGARKKKQVFDWVDGDSVIE